MTGSANHAAIVFSDLDGTLLDHATYAYAPARPALDRMKALGMPLILASSKTAQEIAALRRELGFEHCPAIVENGAGVMPPGPLDAGLASDAYHRLRVALAALPHDLRQAYAGFGDWSAEEVARHTGLDIDQARMARARQYSEPGLWSGSEDALRDFLAVLGEQGIAARRGGRFLTLSFGSSKADRMDEIAASLNGAPGARPIALALGDAPNDMEMLEHADRGVIIANPASPGLPPLAGETTGRITRSILEGPAGWNDAVLRFLEELPGAQTGDRESG